MSTITALFLITVLAALAAAGVALLQGGREASTLELRAANARQAAEAGIEWAMYRIHRPATAQCAASTSLVNLPGALRPYVVTVTCTSAAYTDGAALTRYTLVATACHPSAAGACPNANPYATAGVGDVYVEQVVLRQTTR